MANEETKQILSKYIEGKASNEEEDKIDQFYESFQESTDFDWNNKKTGEKEKVKSDIWNKIQQEKRNHNQKTTLVNPHWMKIASLVVLLISSSVVFYVLTQNNAKTDYKLIEITTQYGETKTITLPDSSVIQLNVGSKLTYYQPFRSNRREVKLSGEAFFQIIRNPEKPFVISSNYLTTTVLGTSFNISSYTNEKENVTVSTGKVKVEFSPKEDKSIQLAYLEPGQQAFLDKPNENLVKQITTTDPNKNWTNHYLSFKNDKLFLVLKKLERIYNVHFEYDKNLVKDKTISSSYHKAGLTEILNEISYMTGLKFNTINKNSIKIM